MAIQKVRCFHDLHETEIATGPALDGNDIHLTDGSGNLNSELVGLSGWGSVPANIRPGWASRSASTIDVNEIENPGANAPASVEHTSTGRILVSESSTTTIRYSDDFGKTWQIATVPAGLTGEAEWIRMTSDLIGYCLFSDDEVVLKTTDGGETWSDISDVAFSGELLWSISAFGDTVIVIGYYGGFYSTDAGVTWTATGTSLGTGTYEIYLVSETVGYTTTSYGNFYKTTNSGLTWTLILNTSGNVKRCYADSNYILGTDDTYNGNFDLKVSDDGGSTFQTVSHPYSERIYSIFADSEYYYIGYNNGKLARAVDPTQGFLAYSTSITGKYLIKSSVVNGFVYFGGTSFLGRTQANSLRSGGDGLKRLRYFYLDYDDVALTYSPKVYTGTDKNYIAIELQNISSQVGSVEWGKEFHFVDNSTGYPTSIEIDVGDGLKWYSGWAVLFTNDNINGYINSQKIVLIEDVSYGSSDDTVTISYYTLLTLASIDIEVGNFTTIRIAKTKNSISNLHLQSSFNIPEYSGVIERQESAITQDIIDTIFSESWCEAGILGLGGSGNNEGLGAIDNIRFLTD